MRIWDRKTADTVFGYLREYGDVSFHDRPMNSVDSLVFCLFAYLKFDGLVPGVQEEKPSVTLAELAENERSERLFSDARFEKSNRELFRRMLAGRRFCSLRLNCHVNIIEKERETQFSAITLTLEDGTVYVAFRGTDETMVGWKEDLNMSFQSPVPGQTLSAWYLHVVSERFCGEFYVGGHSKGGNFAIYGAMNCGSCAQRRIRRIFCLDGPGFRPEVLRECGYAKIADRVEKLLPQDSFVGMLFEWEHRYQVVESRGFGLSQHNPFLWKVKNGEFVSAAEIRERTRFADKAFNRWILLQERQQVERTVEAIYQLLAASGAEDLIAFASHWKRSVGGMVAAFRGADEDTVRLLKNAAKAFLRIRRVKVSRPVAQKKQAPLHPTA